MTRKLINVVETTFGDNGYFEEFWHETKSINVDVQNVIIFAGQSNIETIKMEYASLYERDQLYKRYRELLQQ